MERRWLRGAYRLLRHAHPRNAKTEELKALFSGFIRQYKPVVTSDRSFSHYTSAAFPLVSERK
ncbi:MAG: hypothetical protein IPJ00_21375 [Saprospirales bacterium]|nr:hypothetical protein [Saprospirales bacterium]